MWTDHCKDLGGRFDKPDSPARDATAVTLYPHEYTAFSEGEVRTLPDHPLQTD